MKWVLKQPPKYQSLVFDLFGTITKRRYFLAITAWYLSGKKPVHDLIDQSLVQTIKALSEKYQLHILSNANYEYVVGSLERSGLYRYFDQIVISSQSGARKPSEGAFCQLISRGIKPSKSIFIDDRKINRQVAKRLGFRILDFDNKQDLINLLKQLQKA